MATEPARTFDYRRLLRKYMNHVGECEGITFVPYNTKDGIRLTHHEFTQEELDELHRLEDEIATVAEAIIKDDTKAEGFVLVSEKELEELRLAASYANYD